MKTYVLTVSQTFPKTHLKEGKETGFIYKIANNHKIHTIRSNYALWHKRFEEIEKGKACLSVRVWEGVAYKSKQKELFRFDKADGIGLQALYFDFNRILEPFISSEDSKDKIQTYLTTHDIAKNDGLDLEDFTEWFKGQDLFEPMAIIHFTDFRY